jgi:hypothetical protein
VTSTGESGAQSDLDSRERALIADDGLPDTTAVLLDGPTAGRGLIEFSPDLTPFWRGRYRLGDATIEIRFIERTLTQPASWTQVPCREPLRESDGGVLYHEDAGGWTLLLVASGTLPAEITVCDFVQGFASGYRTFINLEPSGAEPPFPALIEL